MTASIWRDKALAKRLVIYAVLLLAVLLAWAQSRRQGPTVTAAATPVPHAAAVADGGSLELSRPLLLPADGNPFSAQVGTPPEPVAVPDAEPAPVFVPKPEAPDLAVEVVGRMTTVDGKEMVYALHQGQTLELAAGQVLPNGYVVKRMAPDAIEFEYPSMNALRRIELPPTPKFEIR